MTTLSWTIGRYCWNLFRHWQRQQPTATGSNIANHKATDSNSEQQPAADSNGQRQTATKQQTAAESSQQQTAKQSKKHQQKAVDSTRKQNRVTSATASDSQRLLLIANSKQTATRSFAFKGNRGIHQADARPASPAPAEAGCPNRLPGGGGTGRKRVGKSCFGRLAFSARSVDCFT